jgi:predicted nucleic acid-binding protein
LTRFMFDTNIFGKILKMNSPSILLACKHQYFITHVQKDELEKLNNERIRDRLMSAFRLVPQTLLSMESAIADISRADMAKVGDSLVYTHIFEELSKRKPQQQEDNSKDALIAETALKNGFVLVTNNKALKEVVLKIGGFAIDFSVYGQIIRQISSLNTHAI